MYSNIFITVDGKSEAFSIDKIKKCRNEKAYRASGIQEDSNTIGRMAEQVASTITGPQITVEEIQDLVEKS